MDSCNPRTIGGRDRKITRSHWPPAKLQVQRETMFQGNMGESDGAGHSIASSSLCIPPHMDIYTRHICHMNTLLKSGKQNLQKQYLVKNKEGRVYLAQSLRVQSTMIGKAWRQESEAAGCRASTVGKQKRVTNAGAHFPFLIGLKPQPMR